jgi:hypothetical protein
MIATSATAVAKDFIVVERSGTVYVEGKVESKSLRDNERARLSGSQNRQTKFETPKVTACDRWPGERGSQDKQDSDLACLF